MQDPAQYVNEYLPTVDDVLDTVNAKPGSIEMGAGAYLLHQDYSPYQLPSLPAGATAPNDISSFVKTMTVENNTANDVHGQMTFDLEEFPGINEIDTMQNLVQVTSRYYRSGRLILEVPLMIGGFSIPKRSLSDAENVRSVVAHDPTFKLSRLYFDNNFVVPANYDPVAAAAAILKMDKLPPSQGGRTPFSGVSSTTCIGCWTYTWPDANGPGLTPVGCDCSGANIPASRILVSGSGGASVVPTKLTTQSAQLAQVNTLLDMGVCYPLHTDQFGNFLLKPMPYESGYIPVVDWIHATGDPVAGDNAQRISRLIQPPVLVSVDQTAIWNHVVVRSTNNKATPIVVEQYNRSTSSYLSIDALGYTLDRAPLQMDNITDAGILAQRAFIELQFGALGGETVEWSSYINPFVGTHDVHGLYVWSPDGTTLEVDSTANPFLVTSWTIDFQARSIHYVAGRLVPL